MLVCKYTMYFMFVYMYVIETHVGACFTNIYILFIILSPSSYLLLLHICMYIFSFDFFFMITIVLVLAGVCM